MNNKGITLLALVITIIILLILAGISLYTIFNSNLFEEANWAKFATEMTTLKESINLKKSNNMLEKFINEGRLVDEELFAEQPTLEEIPDTLKQEILYIRAKVKKASSVAGKTKYNYNSDNLTNNSKLYYVDKRTSGDKDSRTYIYDIETDTAFKIKGVKYRGEIVHSYNYGNKAPVTTLFVTDEPPLIYGYYAPNLKGFDKENAYVIYYKEDFSDYIEIKAKQFISEGQPNKKTINGEEFIFHDYQDQTTGKTSYWGNIKTIANNKESWWVWIPRYAYKAESETASFDVKFIHKDGSVFLDNGGKGEQIGADYTQHSSFVVEEENITGFWMSKYEATLTNPSVIKKIPDIRIFITRYDRLRCK